MTFSVEEPMDRSGEVEAENPPEVVTVSRRRATASRVSLVVQQDPSPVKSPREEGQQMEEKEEEGENEGGAGMDNEASLSSEPSQIEHPGKFKLSLTHTHISIKLTFQDQVLRE